MNKIFKICAILLGIILSDSAMSQGIEFFHGDYEEALKEAQSQSKPLFIDCYTTWCGPCKKLARTTFMDPKVGDFINQNFVPLKLDMEKGAGVRFGKEFPVVSYPTMYFIDFRGEVLSKAVGFKSPDALIEMCKSVLNNIDYSKDYELAYQEGNREPEFMLKYIESLQLSNKSTQAVANEYFRKHEGTKDENYYKILYHSLQYVDSKLFDKFVASLPELRKYFPNEGIDQKILLASKNTIQRAMEYDVESLKDDAMSAVSNYVPADYEEFFLVNDLEYAKFKRNPEQYLGAVENFVKYFIKSEPEKAFDACLECVELFENETELLDFSEKYLKKLIRRENSVEYMQALAELYYVRSDMDNALNMAEKAKSAALEQGLNVQAIEKLIRRINA